MTKLLTGQQFLAKKFRELRKNQLQQTEHKDSYYSCEHVSHKIYNNLVRPEYDRIKRQEIEEPTERQLLPSDQLLMI